MENSVYPISLLLLFALLSRCCYGFVESSMPNEYMICKPVAGVFGTIARGGGKNDSGILPVLQGPEGRSGAPGKTGLPGPKGEPDYTKVNKIVQEKLSHINARLYTAEQELKRLKSSGVTAPSGSGEIPVPTESPEEAKKREECLTKFQTAMYYKDICYKLIGGEGLLWNFPTAASNCTKVGGYLADLNSRAIYDIVYNYIDETYSTVIQAWTGMRYENDHLLLRNGTQATYSKWSSGYPRKSSTSYYSSYKYVYIYIDTSASVRRLSNTGGHTKQAHAFCQFDLNAKPNSTATTTASP